MYDPKQNSYTKTEYDKLQAENTKLKEIHCTLAEELKGKIEALVKFHNIKFGFEEKIEELQAENAKLKEIIKRFLVIAEALKGGCWE